MKISLFKAALLLSVFGFTVCSCNDDLGQELTGGIIGTVADATTGEPVPTVSVSLEPGGKSAVTGSDGNYLFSELEAGNYTVSISKKGYNPDSRVISVESDKSANGDFLIERIPSVVTVDRDTLDFGAGSDVNSLSFNIVNSSYEDLEWKIEYDCDWIKEIRDSSGVLAYGRTQSIVVFIDRELLSEGKNETVVVVRSSNGSSDLVVTAIGRKREEVVLNTMDVEDITSETATFFGKIINAGTPSYTARGFVYSTSPNPTEATSIEILTAPVTDDEVYSSRVTGLDFGQQYYVRAFAKNDLGTFYSTNQVSFVTIGKNPIVKVLDVSNIDIMELSATFTATIEEKGDPEYVSRGFVYDTLDNPTIEKKVLPVSGTGPGTYTTKVTGLGFNKEYYVRAYVENDAGIFYSDNEVTFSTKGTTPSVSIQEVSNISVANRTVLLNATIENAGIPPYIEKGFVYGMYSNPSVSDTKVIVPGNNVGMYSVSVSDVILDKLYYVKAYAIDADGKTLVYSNDEVTFAVSIIPPEVSVSEVTDIDVAKARAVFNGNVLSVGDPEYTEKGFVYGPVSSALVCENKVAVDGYGTGSYSMFVSSLDYDTYYNVWAYAVNSKGTAYSDEYVSFVIESELPQVVTEEATDVYTQPRSATLNGTIRAEGCPAYTERGFVYSAINKEPTVKDEKIIVSGSGIGYFSIGVDSQLPNDTTYIRAFAISPAGTSYGNTIVVSPPYINLRSAGISVQLNDIGQKNWETINALCEASIIGGYTDWRLPTIDELVAMYTERERIGGFKSFEYWSSTFAGEPSIPGYYEDSYYVVDFNGGSISPFNGVNVPGRCVRTLEP